MHQPSRSTYLTPTPITPGAPVSDNSITQTDLHMAKGCHPQASATRSLSALMGKSMSLNMEMSTKGHMKNQQNHLSPSHWVVFFILLPKLQWLWQKANLNKAPSKLIWTGLKSKQLVTGFCWGFSYSHQVSAANQFSHFLWGDPPQCLYERTFGLLWDPYFFCFKFACLSHLDSISSCFCSPAFGFSIATFPVRVQCKKGNPNKCRSKKLPACPAQRHPVNRTVQVWKLLAERRHDQYVSSDWHSSAQHIRFMQVTYCVLNFI